MENFMILIREDLARMNATTEEELEREIQAYIAWTEQLAEKGHYIGGDPLEPAGKMLVGGHVQSDGPFIEGKEVVTGYILIRASDLDQATALAQSCPVFEYGGALELRQIMKH